MARLELEGEVGVNKDPSDWHDKHWLAIVPIDSEAEFRDGVLMVRCGSNVSKVTDAETSGAEATITFEIETLLDQARLSQLIACEPGPPALVERGGTIRAYRTDGEWRLR